MIPFLARLYDSSTTVIPDGMICTNDFKTNEYDTDKRQKRGSETQSPHVGGEAQQETSGVQPSGMDRSDSEHNVPD